MALGIGSEIREQLDSEFDPTFRDCGIYYVLGRNFERSFLTNSLAWSPVTI